MSTEVCVKLPANGRNNFQHRWANNVGICAVLDVVCQRMQQLPTMLRPAVGIHIHVFLESSTGQVSLKAYLPVYNLSRPDKSTEL